MKLLKNDIKQLNQVVFVLQINSMVFDLSIKPLPDNKCKNKRNYLSNRIHHVSWQF